MAASDYIVGNAPSPASYAAPLLNFGAVADIPDAYFKGTQQARQRSLQQQIIDPKTGQPSTNISTILPELMKRGGAEYSKELLPFLQTQELIKAYQQSQGGGDGSASGQTGAVSSVAPAAAAPSPTQAPATGGPSSHNPAAAGPGNLRVQSQNPAAEGQDTVRSWLTEHFAGQDVTAAIPNFAKAIGASPDAPLTPQQVQKLDAYAQQTRNAMAARRRGSMPGMTQGPSNDDTAINQQSGTITPADRSINGTPMVPVSGASGSGAPQPVTASPRAGPRVAQAGQPQPQAAPAALPQNPQIAGWERAAQGLRAQQQKILQGAQILELAGKNGKAEQDRAAAIGQQAEKYEGLIAKAQEESPEAKRARESGISSPVELARREKINEANVTEFNKKYDKIQALDQEANVGRQRIALGLQLTNNPDFYSGPLEHTVRLYKQFVTSIGGNPNAAMSMEAFHKNANNMLADQVRALGQSGVGQVRVAEVKIIQNGTASLGVTPATNRLILEEADRIQKDNQVVAKMARDYRAAHGTLDPGFDSQVAQYYAANPLFKKEEIADPRLIAPPSFKTPQEAKAAGIPKGWPIKTPNGRIVPMQ